MPLTTFEWEPLFSSPNMEVHYEMPVKKSEQDHTIANIFGLALGKTVRQRTLSMMMHNDWNEVAAQYWAYRECTPQFRSIQETIPRCTAGQDHCLGIEVEVEDIIFSKYEHSPSNEWQMKTDGSLRNNGREYISYVLQGSEVSSALGSLYLYFTNLLAKRPSLSWRTSIHVHLDVTDLTPEQLGKLCVLYSIFEYPLFQYAGKQRMDSVFCVPITKTNLSECVSMLLEPSRKIRWDTIFGTWQKYSALNISRLRDLGTLEFRHMAGEPDPHRIANWINLILSLKTAAVSMSLEEIQDLCRGLNTNSKYNDMQRRVFGVELQSVLGDLHAMRNDLSIGVSYAKQCLMSPSPLGGNVSRWMAPKGSGFWELTESIRADVTALAEKRAQKIAKVPMPPGWSAVGPEHPNLYFTATGIVATESQLWQWWQQNNGSI